MYQANCPTMYNLSPHITLWGEVYSYPHFKKPKELSLAHIDSEQQILDANPICMTAESMHSFLLLHNQLSQL